MGRVSLVTVLALFFAVGSQGAAAQESPGACEVAPLSSGELAAGADEVRRYRAGMKRQFAPDLMGYRHGPRLGPPSRRERRRIRESIGFRRQFALNTNRLLIRRLLRDQRRADHEFGVPLAPLESRSMAFRDKAGQALSPVDQYLRRCARDVDGGLFLTDRVPTGVRIIVSVTAHPEGVREALRVRYRYADLLEVRVVRYSLDYLDEVRERISDDWERLGRLGLDLTSLAVDTSGNRVEVSLRNPSARARRVLARRYGKAVWMDPDPTIVCTLIGCDSGVMVKLTRLPGTARTARVCARGRCTTQRVSRRHPEDNWAFVTVRCRSPRNQRVEVTVELFNASGVRLRFSSAVVRLDERHQPNGPDCGPTCWNAGLRYRGDTGALVRMRASAALR